MASQLTRKSLKHDKFAEEVEHTVSFFAAHRAQSIRYGGVALVAIVVLAAVFYFRNSRHSVREQVLGDAIALMNAPLGAPASPGALSFPTGDAKNTAVTKALNKIVSDYSGSEEAYVAEYYLGSRAADAGKIDEARKDYRDVADRANANYASLAKLALAQIDFASNRGGEAETLLKDLMDRPTDLVSKSEATIAYAKGIASTRPEEARKLLTQLVGDKDNTEASQIAVAALSDLLPRK